MKRSLSFAIGLLCLSACNSETNTPAQADNADAAMPVPETPLADASDQITAQSPQQFVDAVAASDLYEMEAAKVAQGSGKSRATKDFAAMMIKDHAASTAKLKTAAAKAEPPITPPAALPADLQTKLAALKTAGENFDTLYAQQQVEAHDKALALLQKYAQNGSDPGLKIFAGETATVVEAHAKHARELPGK